LAAATALFRRTTMNHKPAQNVATPMPPQAFEIRPNATGGVHIRQDMYESTNGDWLLVETMLDSNAALGHQRHCNCWHYSSKAKVGAPFRFCEHVRAMYEHCGLPYQTVIGQVGEKA
ncbi:hypothetical protein, partial [Vibrio parahaemolyticus]|uniref:hypothetical protein n=1 Tax=Vibrio parahaemolyticus TaxID=670 RepID=UPI0011708C54